MFSLRTVSDQGKATHRRQVVQHVVGVALRPEHRRRRGRLDQTVQRVVAHPPRLPAPARVVGDPLDVAVPVVGVLQVQATVRRRARARGRAVRAARRQAPRVLRQRVHDPVAVAERLDRTVREVAHPRRIL